MLVDDLTSSAQVMCNVSRPVPDLSENIPLYGVRGGYLSHPTHPLII